MSNSKYVYVLSRGHLNRLENLGEDKCVKCDILFEEDDIIATSTSKRYCYECAIKINLVSGNLRKDLRNDKFVPNVLNEIKKLTKKYSIEKETSSLALFLIKTVFENTNYVTKNQLGLSCAAISLADKILKENDDSLKNSLPVTQKVLEKNLSQLQKNLNTVSVTSLSQGIHGVKY
ncbi:MAG: hypothetical protein OEL56_06505 [Nitrosopumilus sp.]|nr:hypothetical protein [Nitrosopumilus sp.]MDH5416894.1 hypothetical protein [Nitrosopumilus sp.]